MKWRQVVLCVALAPILLAAAPVPLASHRATYDISLERTMSGGPTYMRGRTVFELRDNCTSWITLQRFVADMMDSDGEVSRADYTVSTTEAKDGSTMSFTIADAVDGKVKHSAGTAKAFISNRGDAILSKPKPMRFPLPAGAVFPTKHTIDMLWAARSGKGTIQRTVFQGGDKNELYLAIATIAPQVSPARKMPEIALDRAGLLRGLRAWPVLVSYYGYGDDSEAAEYEVSSRLYENGVIGAMSLVYPRFTLRATLTKLETLPSSCAAR